MFSFCFIFIQQEIVEFIFKSPIVYLFHCHCCELKSKWIATKRDKNANLCSQWIVWVFVFSWQRNCICSQWTHINSQTHYVNCSLEERKKKLTHTHVYMYINGKKHLILIHWWNAWRISLENNGTKFTFYGHIWCM